MADRAVTVRGLAERDVTANLATWTINFNAQGTELGAVQAEIDRDARTIAELLPHRRLPGRGGHRRAAARSTSFYDNNRGANIVTINRRLQLRTTDVMRARRAYARQFELIRNGVAIQEGSDIQYIFTRLNDDQAGDDRRGDPGRAARGRAVRQRFRHRRRRHPLGDPGLFLDRRRATAMPPRRGGGARESPLQKVRVVTTIEFYLD